MKFSFLLIHTALFLSLVIVAASCKTGGAPQEETLFYFPEKNVYFDAQTSRYYYSLDSAKTWDSVQYNSGGGGGVLGDRITIPRSGEQAWANNAADRQAHGGVMLNLVNRRTLMMEREDSIKKIKPVTVSKPRQPVVIVEEEEVPQKKGLKKFFNKLFGKKKDKKE